METHKTEHGMIVTSHIVRDKAGDEMCEEIVLSVEPRKRFPRRVNTDMFKRIQSDTGITNDLYS